MGKFSRSKGARAEREIVNRLKEIGVHAERRVRNYSGEHDIDFYPWGEENGALVGEVKARSNDDGLKKLTEWMGENDVLFIRFNGQAPIACMPWRVFEMIVQRRRLDG